MGDVAIKGAHEGGVFSACFGYLKSITSTAICLCCCVLIPVTVIILLIWNFVFRAVSEVAGPLLNDSTNVLDNLTDTEFPELFS